MAEQPCTSTTSTDRTIRQIGNDSTILALLSGVLGANVLAYNKGGLNMDQFCGDLLAHWSFDLTTDLLVLEKWVFDRFTGQMSRQWLTPIAP